LETFAFNAICEINLLWFKFDKQVKFYFGIYFAFLYNMNQLVFEGFATTKLITFLWANFYKADPCSVKSLQFIYINFYLVIPYFFGNPPINIQ